MSCCLAVVYGTLGVVNGSDVNQSVNSFYLSMSHVVWGLGVAWVIFACCTENGGKDKRRQIYSLDVIF